MIRRRQFIAGLGSAVAWPVVARAQQGDRVRRIGVLMPYEENDPVTRAIASAFTQALAALGWTDGRNLRMDLRWARGDSNRIQALAQELVGLQPDVIVTNGAPATAGHAAALPSPAMNSRRLIIRSPRQRAAELTAAPLGQAPWRS